MAKVNNLPASAYAKPHSMSGGPMAKPPGRETADDVKMSLGNIRSKNYGEVKTDGIVTRGNGAATKGITARGPL
jgi:hypothetical protein